MLEKDIFIYESASVKAALKRLDKTKEKVLLVVDNKDRLLGTITDGDVRRYILKGESLDNDIMGVYNKKPLYIKKNNFSVPLIKKMLIENKVELIPVLNDDSKVIDFTTWSEVFSNGEAKPPKKKIDVPVVIMAGGKGERLQPFSKILPKPLFPIGDKPIIEIIVEEFKKQGMDEYYLVLNHKGGMIEAYFNSIEKDYEVKYIYEEIFLGTAGGLKLIEKYIKDVFIVSNCDVIVKANFEEAVNFHKERKASLTVLSSIQHYKIPYGIIKFKDGGEVTEISEKPEYTFPINAGVYVLSREALNILPRHTFFDMTDLLKCLIKNHKKVFTYPVNENDYIDIGQWEEYKKALSRLHELQVI